MFEKYQSYHDSQTNKGPVTSSFIQHKFAGSWQFSHLKRNGGRIIKIKNKLDYRYSLKVRHSYTLTPQSSSNLQIFDWLQDLFKATLEKILAFATSDTILIVICILLQIAAIAIEHNLATALHKAFPEPSKSSYFWYQQPRWKYECMERVELIMQFLTHQPTVFLAIFLFARRLRLQVTRAIILVGIYAFTLNGIVLYITLDFLESSINMDRMRYLIKCYIAIIYSSAVAALAF